LYGSPGEVRECPQFSLSVCRTEGLVMDSEAMSVVFTPDNEPYLGGGICCSILIRSSVP